MADSERAQSKTALHNGQRLLLYERALCFSRRRNYRIGRNFRLLRHYETILRPLSSARDAHGNEFARRKESSDLAQKTMGKYAASACRRCADYRFYLV